MASTIKVDNVQNQPGTNIINKCGTTITVGAACNSVAVTGNVVKSNALQASDAGNIISQSGTTVTLGASGDSIALASGASQTGFGRTGTVDWDTTPKTAGFTAVSGNGYFCNTTSGGFTATLPTSPSAGDIVALKDYALTWNTGNLTIGRGGSPINGSNTSDPVISTQGGMLMFVYADVTKGWIPVQDDSSTVQALTPAFMAATGGTPSTSGDYKIHKFTGPGTLCVSAVGNPLGSATMSYIVVGGAGSGGTGSVGGGGGAGGFREGKGATDCYAASPLVAATGLTVTASPYAITVGGGGAGGSPGPEDNNGTGGNSGSGSVFSTITSAGGGRGSSSNCGITRGPGEAGGSGGGNNSNVTAVNAGNTPPQSPAQGTPGGNAPAGSPTGIGGSGGGATQPFKCGGNPWAGGCGATTCISAALVTYAGGGGGGKASPVGPVPACAGSLGGGIGGTGGGGSGSTWPQTTGEAGTANLGGGGGGGGRQGSVSSYAGGAGGSGIVIIRYKFQ